MRWQFVADVHGAEEKLSEAIKPDYPIALLGDNLNLVDFHTLSGVAARVLTKADIARILMNLGTRGPKKALKLANEIFFHKPERVAAACVEIAKDYAKLAEALPEAAIVLHGNVDWPDLLQQAMGSRYVRAERREVNGIAMGFLSGTGSYPYSMNLPGENSDEAYAEALWSLGDVDVLCTHFPPAIDDLTWDVVAKRNEGGGSMLVDYIHQIKPKLHLFGHIHNPKLMEMQLGSTRLLNVGGFRYHGRVHEIDLEKI